LERQCSSVLASEKRRQIAHGNSEKIFLAKTVLNKTNHPRTAKNDRTRKLSHAPSRRSSSCQLLERSTGQRCMELQSTVLYSRRPRDFPAGRSALSHGTKSISPFGYHITPFLGQLCSSLAFAPAGGASSMFVRVRPQLSVHPARQHVVH